MSSNQRPRLLYVVHSLNVGGAEWLVLKMAEALRNKFSIGILCLDKKGELWEYAKGQGVELFCGERTPGWKKENFEHIAEIFEEFKPDVVHAHQYTPFLYSAVLSPKSSLRFGMLSKRFSLFFTEHGRHFPDVVSLKRRIASRFLARRADAVSAVSVFSKKALIENEGLKEHTIKVIYNGIELPEEKVGQTLREEFDIATDALLIGAVGSLRSIKNPLLLFNAFSKIAEQHSNAHLIYIGDGPLREKLSAEIQSSGLSSRVHLAGVRKPASPYFKELDIYCLPSKCEAASLALLEAMGTGLPVIVSDRGGSKEIVEDSVSGLVVEADEEASLVQALNSLLSEKALREKLGQAAKLRFEEKFSFTKMLEEYEEVYNALLR